MFGVQLLAEQIGASEPALRLLLSTLYGYPIAYAYVRFVRNTAATLNHLYIIVCGLALLLFNYGTDTYHTVLAIAVSAILVRVLHGTRLVATTFIFHMAYLLVGYAVTGTDTYDIKWTMPHCVLVLRLIGLSFDVSDGQRPDHRLSGEQRKTALARVPSVLEVFAFSLFPGSLLVGPQFPYRRYDDFVAKKWQAHGGFMAAGLRRGCIGLLYLLVNQVGAATIPDAYLLSADYAQRSLLYKWFILGLWGKITLYKYISCWLLAEGVCTCFGLTWAGVVDGISDWSGCCNIKVVIFENAEKFQNYVESFNVNTNHWVAEYVFKRLKFLGNRYVSHGAALFFLAVWHGFHSGYYMCFLMEYLVMNFEKEIQSVLLRNDAFLTFIGQPLVSVGVYVALKFYTLVGLGWCLVPFVFLSASKWWSVYATLGYYGYVLFVPFPLYKAILKRLLPAPLKQRKE